MKKLLVGIIGIMTIGVAMIAMAGQFRSPTYNMVHIAVELGSAAITGTTVVRQSESGTLSCTAFDKNGATITDHLSVLCNRNTQYVWTGSGTINFPNSKTTTITPLQTPGTYTYKVQVTEPPIPFPPDYPASDQISTITKTCFATWTLVVLQAIVTGVAMSPLNITLPVDGSITLTGTITDQLGGVVPGAKGTFSCSTGIGTFSSAYGTKTILYTGSQTMNGTVGYTVTDGTQTFSTWTTINVIAGPPAIVLVSPITANMVIGGSQTFHGTITDSHGNKISNILNWSLSEELGALSTTLGISTTLTAGTAGTCFVIASTGTVQTYGTITVSGIKYIPSQTARVPFTLEVVGYSGIATVSVTTGTYTTVNGTFTGPSTIALAEGKGSITLLVSANQRIVIEYAGKTEESNPFWVEGGAFFKVTIEGLEGKYLMSGKKFPLIGEVRIRCLDVDDNLTSPQHWSILQNWATWYVGGEYYSSSSSPLSSACTLRYNSWALTMAKGQKEVVFTPSFPLFDCVPAQFPYIVSQNPGDRVEIKTMIETP